MFQHINVQPDLRELFHLQEHQQGLGLYAEQTATVAKQMRKDHRLQPELSQQQ